MIRYTRGIVFCHNIQIITTNCAMTSMKNMKGGNGRKVKLQLNYMKTQNIKYQTEELKDKRR